MDATAANAGATREALFLFNNCYGGWAAANGRRVAELFARRAPDLDVVAPFGEASPVQRTLFE